VVDPEEKFLIHLTINGDKFPLVVKRKEEKIYRDASDRINETMNRYRSTYSDNSRFDALVMTSIQLAVKLVSMEQDNTNDVLWQTLTEINERLDSIAELKT